MRQFDGRARFGNHDTCVRIAGPLAGRDPPVVVMRGGVGSAYRREGCAKPSAIMGARDRTAPLTRLPLHRLIPDIHFAEYARTAAGRISRAPADDGPHLTVPR